VEVLNLMRRDVFSNGTGNGGEKKRVTDQKNGKMEKS
jgi:hypothetical protein